MNCLDYRRALLAGEAETLAMKAHRLECPVCAELEREHGVFERQLHEALAVEVPETLEQGLLNAATATRRRFLAAASIAALAAGAGTYLWMGGDDPLALNCIEFVMKEEGKSIMMGSMPRDQAEAALADTLPLARIERIGQVRHIAPCPFNDTMAYHVVLSVPQGKVTLLVMPRASGGSGGDADRDGLHSTVVDVPNGTVGIVAPDRAVVRSVAGALGA